MDRTSSVAAMSQGLQSTATAKASLSRTLPRLPTKKEFLSRVLHEAFWPALEHLAAHEAWAMLEKLVPPVDMACLARRLPMATLDKSISAVSFIAALRAHRAQLIAIDATHYLSSMPAHSRSAQHAGVPCCASGSIDANPAKKTTRP